MNRAKHSNIPVYRQRGVDRVTCGLGSEPGRLRGPRSGTACGEATADSARPAAYCGEHGSHAG